MTGAAAYKVWQRALLATDSFRAQSRMGLPQGYERLSASIEVLLALKLVLIESVSGNEDGALGVISRELHLLQQDLARDCEALKVELCAPPSGGSTAVPTYYVPPLNATGEGSVVPIEEHSNFQALKARDGWSFGEVPAEEIKSKSKSTIREGSGE